MRLRFLKKILPKSWSSRLEFYRDGVRRIYREYFSPGFPKDIANDPTRQLKYPLRLKPGNIELGPYTRIQNDVNLIAHTGKVKVGKFTAISSGVMLIPGTHIPTVGIPQFLSILHVNDVNNTIEIGEDCWIGQNAILLCKSKIGRGALVGAMALVTKEVPPYAVVVGAPARIVAAKFSEEQILEHERILYPPEERMSREEVKELFDTHYKGMRVLGKSEISETDMKVLEKGREKFGIVDYSKQ